MRIKTVLLFTLAIALMATIFFSCEKISSEDVVFFDPPGMYKGTYTYTANYMDPFAPAITNSDSVIFDFHNNGHFVMDLVDEPSAHFCQVDSASFSFNGNFLVTDVIWQNTDRDQICSPDHSPTGQFTYDVQDNYIVFTILNTEEKLLMRIELKPYTPPE